MKTEKKFEKFYNWLFKKSNTNKIKTVDNGFEFNAFGERLYKCDPYCSFQRGTNERMNGMVRKFISKGRLLKSIPQICLDDIAFKVTIKKKKIKRLLSLLFLYPLLRVK